MSDCLIEVAGGVSDAEWPQCHAKISHGGNGQVLAKTKGQRTISFTIIVTVGTFEMQSRSDEVTREPARHAGDSVSNPGFRQVGPGFHAAEESVCQLPHREQVSAEEHPAPQSIFGGEPLGHVRDRARNLASPYEGCFRLRRSEPPHDLQSVAIAYLQSQVRGLLFLRVIEVLRQIERFLDVRDCLDEGGALQCQATRLAPPLDGRAAQSSLSEVMRHHLGLGLGPFRNLITNGFGDLPVKLLTRRLWQTGVDNVPHQRVLERVDRIGWHTALKQQPRGGQLVQTLR